MFRTKEAFWVNIDLPTKKFTVHHVCIYTEKIKETAYKGVGNLNRDGGWLQITSFIDMAYEMRSEE